MKKKKRKELANRQTLMNLTAKLTESSQTTTLIKEDRLAYNKLGKFERQESAFRDRFRHKFDEVREMLDRGDHEALKETVKEAEKTYKKVNLAQTLIKFAITRESKQLDAEIRLKQKLK